MEDGAGVEPTNAGVANTNYFRNSLTFLCANPSVKRSLPERSDGRNLAEEVGYDPTCPIFDRYGCFPSN